MSITSNCPICGLQDMVQKVSAIVSGQTNQTRWISTESEIYTDDKGKSQTRYVSVPHNATWTSHLAQKLFPPEQPVLNKGCSVNVVNLFLYYVLIAIVGPMILQGLCGIFWVPLSIIYGETEYKFVNNLGATPKIILTIGIEVFICLLLIGLFFLFKIILKMIQKESRNREEYKQLQAEKFNQEEMPKWRSAMNRWNNLYYCKRDDLIFIPGEGTSDSIDNMMDYIYKQ